MRKRILCGILAAILLLSLIPAIALPTRALCDMKTSEACIVILKEMEGFAEFPYYDYSHYSVGYGTACEEGDYPNGITEEEADALLREYLADAEKDLNIFANRYNILFSQYQFDALMLFTYNCGAGWIYSDSDMRDAVIHNATGNDFIYAYVQWSNAGGQLHTGLINRRLREANMYLNGSYSNTRPSYYTYALFNAVGGSNYSRIQGYDTNLSAPMKSYPSRDGYVFLGWYTGSEGGEWITKLTAAHSQKTFFAHWQSKDADYSEAVAASYCLTAEQLADLDTYDAPGGNVTGSLKLQDEVQVNADYVSADGMKWGRTDAGYWVKLGHPLVGVGSAPVVQEGIKVNVTGDFVNVRTGPGTTYAVVAGVVAGAVVYVTRVVTVDGTLWGQCRAGWLCLEYTDYAGGLPVEEPGDDIPQIPGTPEVPEKPKKEETHIATGTVVAKQLYIRSTPGSKGMPVGSYRQGDRLKLLEIKDIAGTDWGRTDKGWVCLSYVKLDEQEKPQTPAETEPTVPEEPEQTEPTAPPTEPESRKGVPATVVCKTKLNIRTAPGTGHSIAGSYSAGQTIRLLELTVRDGTSWGRTEDGWVCMQYVHMRENMSAQDVLEGSVVCQGGLNIRSGAGVGYAPIGTYAPGTRIRVYGQLVVSGKKWGRTDEGWVCMDYVQLDSDTSETPQPTPPEVTVPETTVPETEAPEQPVSVTGTVTARSLNIRRSPGTASDVVGSYARDSKVTVLETRQVNGANWGRTDKGWICLMYVALDEKSEEGEGFTGEITADALCIRKGPGTGNAVVGIYKRGDAVIILEQIRVGVTFWGRTDKGWICMDYVK